MRFSSLFGPTAAELASIIRLSPLLLPSIIPFTRAVSLTPVPSPNLDLSSLGNVALAGNFDAISLYQYTQQSEGSRTNGSQAVIASLPNGIYADLAAADTGINTMCPFVMKDGTLAGVVVGGDFTSLGGVDAQGVALFDPNSTKITPLPGIGGQVSAVLCDQETNSVYVGGSFKAANSTNAIAWVGMTGWANLPFAGFNAPVTSITKAPSGHIVFGGSFSGLGNTTTPTQKDEQVINLSSARISSTSTTTTDGFNNASNIVCSGNSSSGPGRTWLLSDNEPGSWSASMQFGFEPTKLRLWNTDQDGRGTKTFRFTALPLNGIMNFTYTDPATGTQANCDARCTLAAGNSSNSFQDFHFVNLVGMSGFRIDISDWYGQGGGLNGVELFEDDIYVYADNDFNEPSCANIEFGSNATVTGPWQTTPSGQSLNAYLSADVGAGQTTGASVVFQPDIKQAGNYSVTVYTPGCLQDETCASRGIVNVTASFATGTHANKPTSTQIYQTNDFEKYDQIYQGYVDVSSGSFRPAVTLSPAVTVGSQTIVASRVRFQLLSDTGGLNGLFEFDPNQAVIDADLSTSAINRAGTTLDSGADINALVTNGQTIYAGGKFSDSTFENIMAFSGNNASSLPGGGLNDAVSSMFAQEDFLYVGGNFTNTSRLGLSGLNSVAAYSFSKNQWVTLGAGVDGDVQAIVPLQLNTSQNKPETTIAFSGDFNQVLPFGDFNPITVNGLAIWVPSQNNWLQNLNIPRMALAGQLSAFANVPNSQPMLAGTLSSQGMAVSGAIGLQSSGSSLTTLPINIQPQQAQASLSKRATVQNQNVSGVATGLYYDTGGRNVTILGGHFSAKLTNGSTIQNLLFLNGSNNNAVTGLPQGADLNSTFLSLAVQQDTLFAGGMVSGQVSGSSVNGLVVYDLLHADYVSTQPSALSGDHVVVQAVSTRPGTTEVYVGGSFDSAGSLPCSGLCMYDTAAAQWNRPGTTLEGTISALTWSSTTKLLAAGNITINNNSTTLAVFDAKKQTWTSLPAAANIPGPVTALAPASTDASRMWVTGTAPNGTTFLMAISGSSVNAVGSNLGSSTSIRGLQVIGLSKNHAQSDLLDGDQALLLTGNIDLPNFGNASAVLFNGTNFTPLILSTMEDGSPGSISQLFSSKTNTFKGGHHHHSKGIVILVSLCAALGCLFLIILIGIILDRVQRRRAGYSTVPNNNNTDKHANLGRVPPEHLFQNLGKGHPANRPPNV